jgi:hypothetical protein
MICAAGITVFAHRESIISRFLLKTLDLCLQDTLTAIRNLWNTFGQSRTIEFGVVWYQAVQKSVQFTRIWRIWGLFYILFLIQKGTHYRSQCTALVRKLNHPSLSTHFSWDFFDYLSISRNQLIFTEETSSFQSLLWTCVILHCQCASELLLLAIVDDGLQVSDWWVAKPFQCRIPNDISAIGNEIQLKKNDRVRNKPKS